jgi:hypothetical protein
MMTAAQVVALKAKVKAEMARRSGTGSLASYATTTWDFTKTPTAGGMVLAEHGKKVIEPLLAVKPYGKLKPVVQNDLIPGDFDNANLTTIVNNLAAESTTSGSSSCSASCSGLCKGGCYTSCTSCQGCSGCSGSCSGCLGCGSCGGACDSSCTSCTGTCSSSCVGGCKGGCTATCKDACFNQCGGCQGCSGCTTECAANCGGCTEGCWAACKTSSKPTVIPPFIKNVKEDVTMQNTETQVVIVDEKLSSYIESLQYEVNARKELLLAMMQPSIKSQVDKTDFEAYHKEYVECMAKYDAAKHELEKTYIKPQFPDMVSWGLDFESRELTVACAKKE